MKGTVVGIVEDNQDPDGMHRIKVRYPVDEYVYVTWCRMITPMGGPGRGLVILPDIGTEVLLVMSYQTNNAYVIGGVYNGAADKPEPYHNDDGQDNRRIFWSRNGHMIDFDDTAGAERIGIGALASARLDVTSGPIHHVFDAAQKKITEVCAGTTLYEGKQKVSITCKNFTLQSDQVQLSAGSDTSIFASTVTIKSGGVIRVSSPDTRVKTGDSPPDPVPPSPADAAQHPPRRS
jgi:uncharacterized protein involved in type VI secretion and phage assembly